MNIGNLSASHAFNYIVLRINPGLTSYEDLATALLKSDGPLVEINYIFKSIPRSIIIVDCDLTCG